MVPAGGHGLFRIAHHMRHLGHGGKSLGRDLRGAAGDDDARLRPFARNAANGLPRLPRGLGGHRAGIDDHHALFAALPGKSPDNLGFDHVQAAAESDDLRPVGRVRHPDPAENRRVEHAAELHLDRPGHFDMVVGFAPVDDEDRRPAARSRTLPRRQSGARGGDHRGAGGGAAGERQPRPALPDLQADVVGGKRLGERDIGALRETCGSCSSVGSDDRQIEGVDVLARTGSRADCPC